MTGEMSFKEFSERLLALCAEYEVSIGGCGCCDSPFVDGRGWMAGRFCISDSKIQYDKLEYVPIRSSQEPAPSETDPPRPRGSD